MFQLCNEVFNFHSAPALRFARFINIVSVFNKIFIILKIVTLEDERGGLFIRDRSFLPTF